MGISQQIGASSLIKPGVIDNSAQRPASPYEGQVIFQKDTDQLLVWNGTAWVIPNAPAQNPMGLAFITSATATAGQGSLSINDCFSSTYENYRIVTKFAAATAGYPALFARMRVSNADDQTANYQWAMNGHNSANASASTGAANQTSGYVGNLTGASSFDVISPFNNAIQTLLHGQTTFYDGTSFCIRSFGNWHNVVSSFTGITFFPSASTLTTAFTVRVYGYRNS